MQPCHGPGREPRANGQAATASLDLRRPCAKARPSRQCASKPPAAAVLSVRVKDRCLRGVGNSAHNRFSANTSGARRLSIIGESQRRQSYDVNYKADYLAKDVTFTSASAIPFHVDMKIDPRTGKTLAAIDQRQGPGGQSRPCALGWAAPCPYNQDTLFVES